MSNPFERPTALYPDITQAVDEAYGENMANGTAVDIENTDEPGLDDIANEDVEEAKQNGELGHPAFAGIENPVTRLAFEQVFPAVEKLYSRIGLIAPTPEEFIASGIDFLDLAKKFEEIEDEGLDASVVICPTLPLQTGPAGSPQLPSWEDLYKALTYDKTISHNPLKSKDNGVGLYMAEDIDNNTISLFDQEMGLIRSSLTTHKISKDQPNIPKWRVPIWTVSIMPSTGTPENLNTPHTDYESKGGASTSLLPTISQYLGLQAARIQDGQPPIDSTNFTMLAGTTFNDKGAPAGGFGVATGRVRIYSYHPEDKWGETGTRLPVWG